MSISEKEVRHIARLARISLSPEEEAHFTAELGAILGFVEQLNGLDTDGVAPVNGGTDLLNVMREDEPVDISLEGKSQKLFAAIPEKKENWARVKSVFE